MKKTIIVCIVTLITGNALIGKRLPMLEYFNTIISANVTFPIHAENNIENKTKEAIQEGMPETQQPYFYIACFTSAAVIFAALLYKCINLNREPTVKRTIDQNGFSGSLAREGKIGHIPPPINIPLKKTDSSNPPKAPGRHSRDGFDDTIIYQYNPRYDIALPTPIRRSL